MARYIDANKIEPFLHRDEWGTPDETWRPEHEFGNFIDAIHTADVVEVVRCKDCIHCPTMFLTDERTTFTAYGHCFEFGDNDFCGYGERRNND